MLAAACSRSTTPAAPSSPRVSEATITDGRLLVEAMRRKYDGHWYRTLSFVQNNTLYSASGRASKSQWVQHISVPGKLRIDYLPLSTGSGVLYDGSRVHTFDNGREVAVEPGINPYLLLTADVYVQPAARTIRLLDSLGLDLRRARRDQWEGRPVWIVGAKAGDSTTSQFWIDGVRLVVVRVIQREKRGARTVVTDARFRDFATIDGYPVALEVLLRRDGRLYFREELTDVKVNGPMAERTFVRVGARE